MANNNLTKFITSAISGFANSGQIGIVGKNNNLYAEKFDSNNKGADSVSVKEFDLSLNKNEDKKAKSAPVQVVEVTYGHGSSENRYSYYAVNKRTGDVVTPEVTHYKSKKRYKTLAIVRSTHLVENAEGTVSNLAGRGIALKTIGQTNQRALPGYYTGWGK